MHKLQTSVTTTPFNKYDINENFITCMCCVFYGKLLIYSHYKNQFNSFFALNIATFRVGILVYMKSHIGIGFLCAIWNTGMTDELVHGC